MSALSISCSQYIFRENLTAIFGKINGLLIPGGSQPIDDPTNPFLIAARVIYDLAVDSNAKGDFFPIWVSILA